MNNEEFVNSFQSHVFALSYQKQYELAIHICKILFPDYKYFSRENKWGDPDVLLDAVNLCELYNASETDDTVLKNMLSKVDSITPDTEDFENATYALNACTAVYDTLEFLLDKDRNHILNIGSYWTDSIDAKIWEEGNLTEQQINNHPMMAEARKFLTEFR